MELIETAKKEIWIVRPSLHLWERLRIILYEAGLRNIPLLRTVQSVVLY